MPQLAKTLELHFIDAYYEDISIPIDNSLTINDIKQLVLKQYNHEQSTIASDIHLIEIIIDIIHGNLTIWGDHKHSDQYKKEFESLTLPLYTWIQKYEISFVQLNCVNKNIYNRLSCHYRRFLSFIGRGYSKFTFKIYGNIISDSNTFMARQSIETVIEILTFSIINKNLDGSINIKMDKCCQLNFGHGPTAPQQYFRMIKDGSINYYYLEDIKEIQAKRSLFCDSIANVLLNGICNSGKACKWQSIEQTDCAICMDEKAEICFEKCKHFVCCKKCVYKINNGKCPICRADFSIDQIAYPIEKYF